MVDRTTMASAPDARFRYVEVESKPLGGRVRLDLERSCTILVGRNASGKSLIVETLARAFSNASVEAPRSLGEDLVGPVAFECEIEAGGESYVYEYSIEPSALERDDDDEVASRRLAWRESCRVAGQNSYLWQVDSGQAISGLEAGFEIALPYGSGLLHASPKGLPEAISSHVGTVRRALRGFRVVFPEMPRSRDEKEDLFLRSETANKRRRPRDKENYRQNIAHGILRSFEHLGDDFRQFEQVCTRVLGVEIELVFYRNDLSLTTADEVAEVRVGRDNIGLASDGTLRALDILLHLSAAAPGDFLMIEEPEIGVHPGLLGRILNEIEMWSSHGQVLISTHSPQVLDWRSRSPGAIRVVSRAQGQTSVQRMRAIQVEQIAKYLAEEGVLSDYIFHSDVEGEEALGA